MTTEGVVAEGRIKQVATRMGQLEKLVWASIGRLLQRRPAIEAGGRGFSFHKPVLPVLITFLVVSAVELVIVDIIVARWVAVRIPLLVVGIWGLLWLLGLFADHLMRPHTVGPSGIRVRNGMDLDLPLPWEDISTVTLSRGNHPPDSPKVLPGDAGSTFISAVSDQTNIEIALERPLPVQLPGAAPKGGEHLIVAVRLWADDPDEFLAEAGRQLASWEDQQR